jgi:hypothetical protein
MTRPQVSDGGEGLQICRGAANTLHKQSWKDEKEWSSILGIGRGPNKSSPVKISLLQNITRSFGLERIPWINDLSERKWI